MFWLVYISLILLAVFSGQLQSVHAWFPAGQTPVLQQISETVSSDHIPLYSNKDCQPQITFVTRPARPLNGQSEQSTEVCAVATAYGLQSASDTTVALTGSRLAGPVVAQSGNRLIGQAIPASKHFLFQGGGTYGSKQYLVKNFAENSQPIIESTGIIRHQLSASASILAITDNLGVALEFADVRFSSNGQWLVGDVPFQGLTRVNTETGQTLIFGDAYNYGIGIRPHYVLSISGDGRYVFAAAAGYDILKIYDLANCTPVNQMRSMCPSRDFLPFVKTSLPGFRNVHHAQFSTNKSVRLYINYAGKTGYFLLKADASEESQLDYLALGDSFTSGEGIFDYKTGTDSDNPFNKCHLSDFSYPFLLKQSQQFNQVESVACSGAKMKDIRFDDPTKNYRSDARQSHGKEHHLLDQEIYNNFFVGYRPQIDFVDHYKPRAVTVSIGGNDIGFGHIIANCLSPGTCYKDPTQKADLLNTIASKKDQLTMIFQHIKQAAATNASIYVVGYPSLANPDGACGLNVRLDKNELEFGNEIVGQLNETLQQAAQLARVAYIDVAHVLHGHRLCENTGDQLAINGLTAGNDKTFTLALNDLAWSIDFHLTGRESYHPTKLGHQLYAGGISKVLDQTPPFAAYQSANTSVSHGRRIAFDNGLTPSMSLRGDSASIYASGVLPSDSKQLYLDNVPLPLTVRSISGSSLVAVTEIPASVTPGIYSLRLHIKSTAGEPLEIQKVIYVANSVEDIDGDATPNSQELCLIVEPAFVDADNDTIDDGCDGQIGLPKSFTYQNMPYLLFSAGTKPTNTNFAQGKTSILSAVSSSVLSAAEAKNSPAEAHKPGVSFPSKSVQSPIDWLTIGGAVCMLGSLLYIFGRSGVDRHKHLQ